MPISAQDRRQALRDRLIQIAERQITDNGLASLRARDLAAQAGCAVGAIYNVFGDLTDLVQAVNARTFARLGEAIAAAQSTALPAPTDQLVTMARAYHRFAADNHNAWRALFDIDRPAGINAPDWYLAAMENLFAQINPPLADLFPDLTPADRGLLTRALFSAVHGIVLLGLDRATAGVPPDQIDTMLDRVLRQLTRTSDI